MSHSHAMFSGLILMTILTPSDHYRILLLLCPGPEVVTMSDKDCTDGRDTRQDYKTRAWCWLLHPWHLEHRLRSGQSGPNHPYGGPREGGGGGGGGVNFVTWEFEGSSLGSGMSKTNTRRREKMGSEKWDTDSLLSEAKPTGLQNNNNIKFLWEVLLWFSVMFR